MKNTQLITWALLLLGVLSACSDDETIQELQQVEETSQVDPTIIAEYHQLNSTGDITAKYIFNNEGVLSEIKYAGYIELYNYNTDYKITNISKKDLLGNILDSKDVEYNTDGYITTIGSRTLHTIQLTMNIGKQEVTNTSTTNPIPQTQLI